MVLKQLFGKKSDGQKPSTQVPANSPQASVRSEKQSVESATSEQGEGNEPQAAQYLEQAMIENARNDNPETRRKVYQELLFSDLLLALADDAPNPENAAAEAAKDPSNLSVAILTNSANVQFAAAFTSPAAARRWRAEGGQYVSIRGQDIFKLLEPSPAEVIVLNAGGAPFVVLPKIEYRQLAMGIVPQTSTSPVQVSAGQQAPQPEAEGGEGQMQVAFPPDVFSDEQKSFAERVMHANERVEAAVLGAILPPGADKNAWVRTVFLRVSGIDENQDAMQNFCLTVRNAITENAELFKDVGFEVGVMPDPSFWIAMHQNGIILFDKNPPALPAPQASPEGVVDADIGGRG